ncbi:NAD(P)H azoreductase [Acaryochloris thomasi RCC1774]|uniref:NAD(P)H azoreductase n=1 Tax=Acaryochloris thomasi RCC1774 TaxID=1764569 RepID=A0A2W1JIE2_9CYAN|nr:NmrA/HSCARG family protein [Acaryochloris thomasi]PZD73228.1 NAD(P)H azoreductase [Acaryochloris thomasi RCC1774]
MQRILVIGSTGAMGSSVIRALVADQSRDCRILAMTRNPSSDYAKQLGKLDPQRIELIEGDLDDESSVKAAMEDIDTVFCNTAFFASGSVDGERAHAHVAIEAARQAGVNHFIYSSLDPASRLSGGRCCVPHYDAKASIEADIDYRRSDEFMRQVDDGWFSNHVSVLVTCPYIENFYDFFTPEDGELPNARVGKIFRGPIIGSGIWQMVALEDIGYFARMMVDDRQTWGGRTLRIASEEATMHEIVSTFEEVTGIPAVYQPMTEQEFLNSGLPNAHDPLNNMLIYRDGFFEQRNFEALRKLHPGLKSFRKWLHETGWRGEARSMRKTPPTG